MFAGLVSANDTAEMADLQARIATLEAKLMAPAGGGDAESLTSLKKKGAVKIGGDVEIDLIFTSRDEANNSTDSINRSRYASSDADLNIRVDAGTDTYLFIKLDLDDTGTDGDLTEEIQFVWENVRGSNWKVILGKDEVPFGQDKDMLIADPYVHGQGSAGGVIVDGGEAFADTSAPTGKTATNNADSEEGFHESQVIMGNWIGEVDNRWGVSATYKYKELGTLEVSAFQNLDDMHEDRSEDTGLQSWATRLTVKPIEGLKITGSFINQHINSMDEKAEHMADAATTTDGTASLGRVAGLGELADTRLRAIAADHIAEGQISQNTLNNFNATGPSVDDDQMATSLAFDYVTKDEKWNFYGEWIYTWHAAHYEELSAQVVSVGAVYSLTPKIDLVAQGDMALLDNAVFQALGITFEENIYHAAIGARYTCDNGIVFVAEYGHEWYKTTLEGWDDGEGDMIAFRTAYSF
ncbi:MAG: hypothetical protein ACYTFY_03645 [Planctomycetota bacterium]